MAATWQQTDRQVSLAPLVGRPGSELAVELELSRMQTKHSDECLARQVMSAALSASVKQHDDGSRPAMYDLDVNYLDGRSAAAEVVSTRDSAAFRLWAAATKIGYVRRPELSKRRAIVVEPGAHLKGLRRAAPRLLAQLERNGVEGLSRRGDAWPPELTSFGVVRCWSYPPTPQQGAGFFMQPIPTGVFVGLGNDAVRACDEFLAATPDVPAKLVASGKLERHAVVVVTVDWLGPFSSIEGGALPTMAPTLPEGVDRLWMVTFKSPPIRAIYWLGDGVWREVVLNHVQGGLSDAAP